MLSRCVGKSIFTLPCRRLTVKSPQNNLPSENKNDNLNNGLNCGPYFKLRIPKPNLYAASRTASTSSSKESAPQSSSSRTGANKPSNPIISSADLLSGLGPSRMPVPSNIRLFTRLKEPVPTLNQRDPSPPSQCPVFDAIEELELSLKCSAYPGNQFDEWLQWTLEGKIWQFPIDNEQDFEERSVPFYEHIFLDKYVDKDLVKTRPLAVFMDLVAHGLANNPHITVQQKREHLQWFASYFKDKISAIEAVVDEERRLSETEKANSPTT